MGLSLSKTNSAGFSVSYWKIADITIGSDRSLSVIVYAYLDRAARLSGKDQAFTRAFTWDATDATNPILLANWTAGKNIWQLLYAKAKQSAFFSGAVDVLEVGQTT
jgi:hypothetical protein